MCPVVGADLVQHPICVRTILLNNIEFSRFTGRVNPMQGSVKSNGVRTASNLQRRDDLVMVDVKHDQRCIVRANRKQSSLVNVNRQAGRPVAGSQRPSSNNRSVGEVNSGHHIGIGKILIEQAGSSVQLGKFGLGVQRNGSYGGASVRIDQRC